MNACPALKGQKKAGINPGFFTPALRDRLPAAPAGRDGEVLANQVVVSRSSPAIMDSLTEFSPGTEKRGINLRFSFAQRESCASLIQE